MSEQNKDLMRRFAEEVFTAGDVDRVEEFCAPDFVDHQEGPPGTPSGIEGMKAIVAMYHEAFPDLAVNIEDVIAEGDRVVIRATFTGTHRGELMGILASGKRVEVDSIDIVRIEDGKAAEHWGVTDTMALMEQIGAVRAQTPA
jgi:steroid delta-isomerase-like uncharacterized protein